MFAYLHTSNSLGMEAKLNTTTDLVRERLQALMVRLGIFLLRKDRSSLSGYCCTSRIQPTHSMCQLHLLYLRQRLFDNQPLQGRRFLREVARITPGRETDRQCFEPLRCIKTYPWCPSCFDLCLSLDDSNTPSFEAAES